MKKKFLLYIVFGLLVIHRQTLAQADLQNTGIIYVSGSSDTVYINGSLTNAATAALNNNGNLFVRQNIANSEVSMQAGLGTLYLNGSLLQTLSGPQPFKTFNFVTANNAGFLINDDISVSGLHNFLSGIITTSVSPNYVIYETGASVTGDGDHQHVKGWVRKIGTTSFIFPVGNGNYERVIGISNLSAASVYNARYAGPTTNTANVVAPLVVVDPYEYWMVNQLSGGSATIDMNWDNSKVTMPAYPLPAIRVANYISGNWAQVGGNATGNTAATGTISSGVVAGFGAFTLGSTAITLPLNLIAFDALRSNGTAVITWTTTNEINVSHFEIERSDDGLRFYVIAKTAASNQAALHQYVLTDNGPLGAATYYRLRTADLDGTIKISKVVKLGNNGNQPQRMTAANPVRHKVIMLASNISGSIKYSICTLSGQTIQKGVISMTGAVTNIPLSGAVKPGSYILVMKKAGYDFTQQLFIQ